MPARNSWTVALLLLLASPAFAWDYQGPPRQIAELKAAAAKLPPCVTATIDQKLRLVFVSKKRPIKDYVDGISFKTGFMLLMALPVGYSPQTAYLHELGHFYAWQLKLDRDPKLAAAVMADYGLLNGSSAEYNSYLDDPEEAYAEVFAAHFLGPTYFKTDHYNVDLFPRTKAYVEGSLCK